MTSTAIMRSAPAKPCVLCLEQVRKRRHDKPHSRLVVEHRGPDVGHMFGGGSETRYRCLDCGETIIHSTDRVDPPWC